MGGEGRNGTLSHLAVGKITHTHTHTPHSPETYTYISTHAHTHTDSLINTLWILLEKKWLKRTQEAPENGI